MSTTQHAPTPWSDEREEWLDLLLKALPCVEESEQFDKPTARKLSKRIREIMEANP